MQAPEVGHLLECELPLQALQLRDGGGVRSRHPPRLPPPQVRLRERRKALWAASRHRQRSERKSEWATSRTGAVA